MSEVVLPSVNFNILEEIFLCLLSITGDHKNHKSHCLHYKKQPKDVHNILQLVSM